MHCRLDFCNLVLKNYVNFLFKNIVCVFCFCWIKIEFKKSTNPVNTDIQWNHDCDGPVENHDLTENLIKHLLGGKTNSALNSLHKVALIEPNGEWQQCDSSRNDP